MRVLVFGGSFDPVHCGHIGLLLAADRRIRPDRILLLPAGRPPHKSPPVVSFPERASMLRLALRLPALRGIAGKMRICNFESRGRGPHFTYRALRHIRRRYPEAELYLLLGSDQLAAMGTWRHLDEIRKTCSIVGGRRPGSPRLLSLGSQAQGPMSLKNPCRGTHAVTPPPPGERLIQPGVGGGGVKVSVPRISSIPGIVWLEGRFPDVSSSRIRRMMAEGRDPGRWVPGPVRRRILLRGHYGVGWHRWLKKHLDAERYRHTRAVTRTAGELAEAHGMDVWKAQAAALLHDSGRGLSTEGMVRYARRRRLRVPLRRIVEEKRPMLLHSFVSADIARRRFGVRDPEVLGAIAKHTLGSPKMSRLEKLLYVADAGSEDRSFAQARRIRTLAGKDLDRALRMTVRLKLGWVRRKGQWLHPLGKALWRRVHKPNAEKIRMLKAERGKRG